MAAPSRVPRRICRLRAVVLAMTLWVGLRLLMPDDTFPLVAGYRPVGQMAPEAAWGAVALSCGALWIAGLVAGKPMARAGALLCVAAYWGTLAASFAIASPQTLGAGIFGILAAASAVAAGEEIDECWSR